MLTNQTRLIGRTLGAGAALFLLGAGGSLSGCHYDEPGHTRTVTKTTTDTPTAKTTVTETHEKDTRYTPPPPR